METTVKFSTISKFFKSEPEVKDAVLNVYWSAETEQMANEKYKEVFACISEVIQNNKAKYWLGDTRKFRKTVSPELQEWYAKEIVPQLIEVGLEKIALIAPEEFIAELSVEQSVDEILLSSGNKLTIQYFDNIEEARNWVS